MTIAALSLLRRALADLGVDGELLVDMPSPAPVPLPSRLATGDLAWASVAAALLSVHGDPATLGPERIALSYRSDRHLSIGGVAPSVWSPYSGFWRTTDGWIRSHGNYPHHAAALRAALHLDLGAAPDLLARALAERKTADAVAMITGSGGLVVPVRRESAEVDSVLRAAPLLEVQRFAHRDSATPVRRPDPSSSLAGIRVLDLTRVIAGPVCTRTLALWGADVLRIDPPHLSEPAWQHLDTGHGKRSARLDARSERMHELLAEADVVVLGYRPTALTRLGLDPDTLIERYPGLVIAQLTAWGIEHPDRRGFDSLVQAESGISWIESPDGARPGSLPAQALDHSAGYLLAAAIATLMVRRAVEPGSWLVRTSLRRLAAELLGMPRRADPATATTIDPAPHRQRFDVDGVELVTVRPVLPHTVFAAPHPWGSDAPDWS